jgi:hypothetical protein
MSDTQPNPAAGPPMTSASPPPSSTPTSSTPMSSTPMPPTKATPPAPPPTASGAQKPASAPPTHAEAMRAPDPKLDYDRVVETVVALRDRIQERFPGSGLGRVAEELLRISRITRERVEWVDRPHLALRAGAGLLTLLVVVVMVALIATVDPTAKDVTLSEFLQALEAGVNDVILVGAAIFFLVTMEGRIKRRRALGFLRELRAVAHIVDMHQLTKDPGTLMQEARDTPSSPRRTMTRYDLSRYLDYCSEMLALNSKLAALYAQHLDDAVVLGAVQELEELTTGMSAKIWQKMVILNQPGERAAP